MRNSVVFFFAVSIATFGLGLSLQCFSCPGGSTSNCEIKQECPQEEDGCVKVTRDNTTYTTCVRYADCDFRTLSARFILPSFTFSCCQKNLCNGPQKGVWERFKDFFRRKD